MSQDALLELSSIVCKLNGIALLTCVFEGDGLKHLCDEISNPQNTTNFLKLSCNDMQLNNFSNVSRCVHNLSQLWLGYCNLDKEGFTLLTSVILYFDHQLTLLTIGGNKIDSEIVPDVAKYVHKTQGLELRKCGMNADDVNIVSSEIKKRVEPMTWLDLSCNNFGDKGAISLADCVNKLQYLVMDGCDITPVGEKALKKANLALTCNIYTGKKEVCEKTLSIDKACDYLHKTQIVGTNGATLAVCGCLLTIPVGACDEDVEISITSNFEKLPMSPIDTENNFVRRLTPLLECKPEGLFFKKPVEITLLANYRNEQNPVSVKIRHKTDGFSWKTLTECFMYQCTQLFTFQTKRFGCFDVVCDIEQYHNLMREKAIILAVSPSEENIVSEIIAHVHYCDNIESKKPAKPNRVYEIPITLRVQDQECRIKLSAENTVVDPVEESFTLKKDSWQFCLTRPGGENWKKGKKKVKLEIIFNNPNQEDIVKNVYVEGRHFAAQPPTHVTNIEAENVHFETTGNVFPMDT
uniref:Protein NLRC3-like n=1 Tax=Phallusia mammillata TaxID=59560 RepID=A0A6F9DN69_9ASCI|nr:protein NLRC3-like [Phallusia mammillata]